MEKGLIMLFHSVSQNTDLDRVRGMEKGVREHELYKDSFSCFPMFARYVESFWQFTEL